MWQRLIVLLAATISLPALAHDLWIEKEGSEYVLRYGHRGAEVLPLEEAKLKHIFCMDDKGQKVDVRSEAVIEPKVVRIKATCKCLSIFYHGGFYSITPEGEKNLPKNQVKDVVKSWESMEFVKFMDAGVCETTFGDELEIIPDSDIRKAHIGDKITFRVLYQEKPAAGATIAYHDHTLGEIDSKGEARVRLRQGGLQFISASLKRPLNSPEADSIVLSAGLLFEVAQ
jgi:nickel transport protein